MPVRLACWLIAAALLAACDSGHGNNETYSGKTIKVGAVLSLTGPGAPVGMQSRDGMLLAVKQTNASGGVEGAMLELSVEDDASDKTQAALKARSLIQQAQVLALLGPSLANSATEVHPLSESLGTPTVAVSTPGSHIVPDCKFPDTTPCKYVFRSGVGEETAIPANIKSYADDAHPSTGVLLVAQDDRFSNDDGKLAADAFARNGIKLVKTIAFNRNEANLAPFVTQLVQLEPDVAFIASPGDVPARIMVAARNLGYQGQFLGGDAFNSAAVARQAGAAGRGARSAAAWFAGNTSARNKLFVDAFHKDYAKDPDEVAAQAFIGVQVIADAAGRAGLTFTDVARDRDRLRAAMESVSVQSPAGLFRFTAGRDAKQPIWIVQMDGRGGSSLVKEIEPAG